MKKVQFLTILAMSLAGGLSAKTVYVDVNRPDNTGDGLSWTAAKRTIQAGIDASVKGDTVLVAPGVYSEDGNCATSEEGCTNRVYINHAVTLKSRDGAAVTHIVGAHDPEHEGESGFEGCGPAAVRCVLVTDATAVTVIEGFTLRDGAAHNTEAKQNKASANGGGLRGPSTRTAYLVDCVVSNCVGTRGAALVNASAVRTLFVNNVGAVKGAVGAYFNTLFCAGIGNRSQSGVLCVGGTHVNDTYTGNAVTAATFSENAVTYNAVVLANGVFLNSDPVRFYHSILPAQNNTSGEKVFEDCLMNASPFQLFAPILGDFRLLPTSDAVGFADPSAIEQIPLPSSIDGYKDLFGNTIDVSRPLHAGAVQTLSPEPASGSVWFKNVNLTINGQPALGTANYLFTETYPTQLLFRPVLAGTTNLFAFRMTGGQFKSGVYRFPKVDDSLWFMPPWPGTACTNEMYLAPNTLFVDASAPAGGTGTREAPFNNIQAAVDSYDDNGYHVIRVAPGRYDSMENVKSLKNLTNRVSLTLPTRLIGAGPDQTFVVGASDPDSPSGDGRGPAALRCVAITGGPSAVQNMTLLDGRCGYSGSGTEDIPEHAGAGMMTDGNANVDKNQLLDCVVSNCVSYRGAVYAAAVFRTRITDCLGYNGGIRYSRLVSCIVDEMRYTGGNSVPFSYNNWAVNTTFIGNNNEDPLVTDGLGMTNCVLVKMKNLPNNSHAEGSCVWDVSGTPPAQTGASLADPQLTRQDEGDYVPLSSSPVVGGGVLTDCYFRDYSCDFYGNPLTFVEGRPSAGAIQITRPGYAFGMGGNLNGVSLIFDSGAYGELTPGQTVQVTVDPNDATRPYLGMAVNGEEQPASKTEFSFTATGAEGEVFVVNPLFGTNWYVNASAPSGGSGFTPETAQRTFADLFGTRDVLPGDVVHAAPGVYDEGEMEDGVTDYVRNRLIVPRGVVVTADAGPEVTVIKGASSTMFPDAVGRGTNSVRCVLLRSETELCGFTLTGGRTCGDGAQNDVNFGGGVRGDALNTSRVVDCVISNNASSRGGGAHNVTLVGCRLFDNYARNNRAGASNCNLYNCIIDHNRGVNSIQNCFEVYNCTFGTDATTEDGAPTYACALPLGPIVNCAILGDYYGDGGAPFTATNCVFAQTMKTGNHFTYVDCATASAEALAMDADYRPILGACAVIDVGANSAREVLAARTNGRDALGGARISNGTIDVGAVEADWRPRYTADLRNHAVSVTEASPEVVESPNGFVRIPSGSLTAVMNVDSPGAKCQFEIAVHGAGTMTVTLDDAVLEPLSEEEGLLVFAFVPSRGESGLVFKFEPASDDAFAEIGALMMTGGTFIILK